MMVVHLAVGMRGLPDSDRDDGDVFLLCGRNAHPFRSQKGSRSHSDGIKHARVEASAPSVPTTQGRR